MTSRGPSDPRTLWLQRRQAAQAHLLPYRRQVQWHSLGLLVLPCLRLAEGANYGYIRTVREYLARRHGGTRTHRHLYIRFTRPPPIDPVFSASFLARISLFAETISSDIRSSAIELSLLLPYIHLHLERDSYGHTSILFIACEHPAPSSRRYSSRQCLCAILSAGPPSPPMPIPSRPAMVLRRIGQAPTAIRNTLAGARRP